MSTSPEKLGQLVSESRFFVMAQNLDDGSGSGALKIVLGYISEPSQSFSAGASDGHEHEPGEVGPIGERTSFFRHGSES